MEKNFTQQVRQWFNERLISDAVLDRYGVAWNETIKEIVIPIRDGKGNLLFNKYRRNPFSKEGPKYKYDQGSTSELFPLEEFSNSDSRIILCEGELDALCLISSGYRAVSSTGGSGSFKEEWVPLFSNKEVYICYDNDEAGIKGALNVQYKIPWAKIIQVPKSYGVKDITDYLKKHYTSWGVGFDKFDALIAQARQWHVPGRLSQIPSDKKEMKAIVDALIKGGNELLDQEREMRTNFIDTALVEKLREHYGNCLAEARRALKYFDKPKVEQGNRIISAKQMPIDAYIRFNRNGFANCIWHTEKTPSMFYYKKQNRVKCFGGCGQIGDTIDVVMQLNGCGLKEALNTILGK